MRINKAWLPHIELGGCVIGAAIVRMAIDVYLEGGGNWWLAVAVILAPAAIASYRSTVAPEESVRWGYRLCSIMIGLIIGGRL